MAAPHPEADEAGFADRGVYDTLAAEAFPEALGDFVGAVVFGDFLAHDDDVFIALEFFGEGVVEGLAVGDDGHAGKIFNFRFDISDEKCGRLSR